MVIFAPPKVTVPEQLVLVAVMVLEVKPKAERQPLELPTVPAWVTVKPTGKVTVSVPDSVAERVKTRLKSTFPVPALSRERLRVPAVVWPLILKVSVPWPVVVSVSVAMAVVVCEAFERVPTFFAQVAGVWLGLKMQVWTKFAGAVPSR